MNAERAQYTDISQLAGLRVSYLIEDFGTLNESDEQRIRSELPAYFEKHLNNDLFAYVIREEGRIVCCAFLLIIEKPMSPSFINGRTGTVLNVYTDPSYRRRGYAKQVMEYLIHDAADMDLCRIDLKATEDGYALYKSLGFMDEKAAYHAMKKIIEV